MSQAGSASEWDIYLLAGIGSTPAIFDECIRELKTRFGKAGRDPVIRQLLPYGDHTQKLWRQVLEVAADLVRIHGAWRSGGRETAGQVRQFSSGRRVLFIGHSGGGVAAYHAAAMLSGEKAITDFRIVQVGSPKVPIRIPFRSKVSYFVAVDEKGNLRDPVARLGSWSGWSRGRLGMFYWNRLKYAPGFIGTIPVLGGHEHYFRNDSRYTHPERGSNLSRTLDTIWEQVAEEAVEMTESPR